MIAIAKSSRDAGGDGRWEFDVAMESAWLVPAMQSVILPASGDWHD